MKTADSKVILLAHGSGGKATHQLIEDLFVSHFKNSILSDLTDAALLPVSGNNILFTTDSYVVDPIFFPGGDIGTLSVYGTVNDLAVCGGKPLYLSLSIILEEGFSIEKLTAITQSIANAAVAADVTIVTGDTKVVEHGNADKIFINTAGIAQLHYGACLSIRNIRPGDAIILSGSIGDHGIAILLAREGLQLEAQVSSDSAPLHGMVADMMQEAAAVRFMRDPTRGGIATTLNEICVKSQLGITIFEAAIPIKPQVAGACEILGLDPLYVANEGKLIAIVDPLHADKILTIMRRNPFGADAAIIGTVTNDLPGTVVLKTKIGGSRIVDMLAGEQLPRIC